MSIKLSNGTTLYETGDRDSRGYQILLDDYGAKYTQRPDGSIVLSSGSGFTSGDAEIDTIAGATKQAVSSSAPRSEAFQIPSLSNFRDKAEGEVSAFFDKEFELLAKQIELARGQATKQKDTSLERISEDKDTFFNIEDKTFARALERTQFGFAGKGTADSGFRLKAVNTLSGVRQDELEKARTQFARQTQDTTTNFADFLDSLELTEKRDKLSLERAKESAILSRQRQLQSEDILRRQSEITTFDDLDSASIARHNFG